jgi:hypothetical protein
VRWRFLVQASAAAVDKLVVRGDGETTVTTADAGVTAVIAQASAASYTGTVMEVQTTNTAAGSGFQLLHVGVGSRQEVGAAVGFVGYSCVCACAGGRACAVSAWAVRLTALRVCVIVAVRDWRAAQAHTPSSLSSFAVRGDGVTTLVTTADKTTAVSVSATAAAFTKTVVAVSTTKAAAANFNLLTVRVSQEGRAGSAHNSVRLWCGAALRCVCAAQSIGARGALVLGEAAAVGRCNVRACAGRALRTAWRSSACAVMG